jgi:PadR family transcriptional regulator PadR
MIEELRRHGYELSTGTLYPILHGLEQAGLLTSTRERDGGTERRVNQATPAGRKALAAAKTKVRELFGELFEDEEENGIMSGSLSWYRTGAIDWRARIFGTRAPGRPILVSLLVGLLVLLPAGIQKLAFPGRPRVRPIREYRHSLS